MKKQNNNFTINPACTSCGENYNIKRHELGYSTCLSCGSKKNTYTVAPAYSKGAYQLITISSVRDIGR
tara:strand:+ start:50 stop:253 length:204 start_codon:yes stop_codon:yes gene_type:complete